jgi:hypothetical protein
VVALTLVAATTLFATATLRDATLDTALTSHISAQAGARLAAISALESVLSEPRLAAREAFRQELVLGPQARYRASVTVRYLGRSSTDGGRHHFELTAEVAGPRHTRHHRRLYHRVPAAPDPPIE